MEKFQSDPDELIKQIQKLRKRRSGKYPFIWNHPIKLPLDNSMIKKIEFWDRKNDCWITLDQIDNIPHFKDFPTKNISMLPDEKDFYLIIGSFNVTLKKYHKNLEVTIEITV